jgi:hypothetical protein
MMTMKSPLSSAIELQRQKARERVRKHYAKPEARAAILERRKQRRAQARNDVAEIEADECTA